MYKDTSQGWAESFFAGQTNSLQQSWASKFLLEESEDPERAASTSVAIITQTAKNALSVPLAKRN